MFNKKNNDIEVVEVTKTRLSIEEYRQFIDCVSGSVVIENSLHKENFEPVFLMTCLDMFTSAPLIKKETDKDGNELIDFDATYKFCLDNDVISQIKTKVSDEYIEQLYSDCVETIEFKKNVAIAMSSPLSDLLTTIKNVVENMDMSKATDIIEMASKMNNAGFNDSGKVIDMITENNKKKDVK